MRLHPAFWASSQDADGVISGLWDGKPMSFNSQQVPPEILFDVETARVFTDDTVAGSLKASRANVDAVLHKELSTIEDVGTPALTELAHIMLGLPRHAALAASDAPDRATGEALTKLSIHWTRNAEPWRELVRSVVGCESSELFALPTTTALQLALEELASHDLAAYLTVVSAFGLPGDEPGVNALAQAAQRLVAGNSEAAATLEQWAAKAASLQDNYSSVKSLRAMGSLADTDFFALAVASAVPADSRRLLRTTGAIRGAAETINFFGFGIGYFFRSNNEPFPRRKTVWAGA
jgi:hypothetical protein